MKIIKPKWDTTLFFLDGFILSKIVKFWIFIYPDTSKEYLLVAVPPPIYLRFPCYPTRGYFYCGDYKTNILVSIQCGHSDEIVQILKKMENV